MNDRPEAFRVLVVDDDLALVETLTAILEARYHVASATSGAAGLKLLETHYFHVIISDWQMPQMDGIDFLHAVQEKRLPTACLLMTGQVDTLNLEVPQDQRRLMGILAKPFSPAQLFARVEQLARLAKMKQSVHKLRV